MPGPVRLQFGNSDFPSCLFWKKVESLISQELDLFRWRWLARGSAIHMISATAALLDAWVLSVFGVARSHSLIGQGEQKQARPTAS